MNFGLDMFVMFVTFFGVVLVVILAYTVNTLPEAPNPVVSYKIRCIQDGLCNLANTTSDVCYYNDQFYYCQGPGSTPILLSSF